jgi:hypothetical protein
MVIGSDNAGNLTTDAISILNGATLALKNVDVYEASGNTGIKLDEGELDVVDLRLGGNLPNGTTFADAGGTGIECRGTVTDKLGNAAPSLVSRGQDVSIDVQYGCVLTLSMGPIFGWPSDGGYTSLGQGCAGQSPLDNTGIVVANGYSWVTLGDDAGHPAKISCMTKWGVAVATNTNVSPGLPSVTLNADIENCSAAGIYVTAGTVVVNRGSIDHNFIGVDMESDGVNTPSVTLNDGTQTNNVTVACNSNQETGVTDPGVDVVNNSTGALVADYVNWNDWYDPNGDANAANSTDVFLCGPTTSTCTCDVLDSTVDAGCVDTPGADGMDLVLGGSADAGPTGTATFTNGAAASCP